MGCSVFFSCFLIICFSHFPFSISQILLLPLTHSLSKTQFTSTHHLLKSASTRSATRFHNHHQHHHSNDQVSLPLSPGSDYTLSLTLGSSNSSQPVSLYLDTGSDLVWFPCKPFECILCEGEIGYPNKPVNITPSFFKVPCKSTACSAAHSSLPSSDLCAIANCPLDSIELSACDSFSCPNFYYAYGDGSFVAKLYMETISLQSIVLRNFTFGCSHASLAEPIGVAGFGRGVLSLPNQLSVHSPQLGTRFSYCLVSHSFQSDRMLRPSPLILGRYEDKAKKSSDINETDFLYTLLLENPKHPYFYSVGLDGISVGKKRIPSPAMLRRIDTKGGGGMVVDSGTTFTMIPASFYNSVVGEFDQRVGRVHKRAREIEGRTGLGPCYYLEGTVNVPRVIMHFGGGESSVVLPKRNYFYEYIDDGDDGKKRNVGCLMLMNGGDEEELAGGPGGTLGNYQQQGFEVVYDLEKQVVGFARRRCASLWESLNKS